MKFVYSIPFASVASTNLSNGIHQVVHAMNRYLPEFGYRLTENPDQADLRAHHAGEGNGATDVAIIHGLHPTQVEGVLPMPYQFEVNARVIKDAVAAREVIVPSQWVADLFRRDMLLNPHVIQWGVDVESWQHDDPHEGYVLWNKGRVDPVCTTDPLNQTAARLPRRRFVSTFGDNNLPNLKLVGRIPHADMRRLIQRAGVYLATTKETGDIGSREALAAGVPVVAFRWGATPDVVQHGVNGYLAEPGDTEALARGIEYCFQYRRVLSANAQALARVYDWSASIAHMARVFDQAVQPDPDPLVSIIIPTFNYAHFVLEAIQSVVAQQTSFSFEIIVVNDGSTDATQELLDNLLARWPDDAPPLRVIHQANCGVAHARNVGLTAARGTYAACLDADDCLDARWLEVCTSALQRDPALGIAFTRLRFYDGGSTNWLTRPLDYNAFCEGFNQIPTCCLFRRADALRVGGFRQYMKPAEDADLWLRLQTFTGKRAACVSSEPLFVYRMHPDSVTAQQRAAGRPDPFTVRAAEKQPTWAYKRPFAAPVQGKEASHPVRNYDAPMVCFILRGEGDWQLTLDSIENQTYPFWTVRDDPRLPVAAYRQLQFQDAPVRVNVRAGAWLAPDWLEQQLITLDSLPPYESEVDEVLMAGCCGGKLVSKSSTTYAQGDFVLVEFLDQVAGKIQVRGAVTHINYQKRKQGERFLMHHQDAAAAPHRFKVIPPAAKVTLEVQARTEDPPAPTVLEADAPPKDAPPAVDFALDDEDEAPKVKSRPPLSRPKK